MDGAVRRMCTRTCEKVSFFDRKKAVDILTGLRLLSEWLPCSKIDPNSLSIDPPAPYLASMEKYYCLTCNLEFKDSFEMKSHFKSKMHLAHMNATLNIPQPITADSWPSAAEANSSDSDSGSSAASSSSDELPTTVSQNAASLGAVDKTEFAIDVPLLHCKDALGQPMVFFRNRESEIIGIFRCLLYTKLNMPNTVDELLQRVSNLRQSRYWAILLYSGGKFSAGIFDEDKELIHKTFHRYTVRAKQGGSQASRDSASGGMGGQKSAGSNLRRHGEQAIRSQIAHLLHVKWRPYLQACQLILTWTPKVHRGIFFTPPTSGEASIHEEGGGEEGSHGDEGRPMSVGSTVLPPPPPPDHLAADAVAARLGVVNNDLRLRRLPCRAKNITYAHVKELQREFSSFRVFDSLADFELIRQSERKQLEQIANNEGQTVYESKSGRLFFGSIPFVPKKSTPQTVALLESSEEINSEDGEHDLDEHNQSTPRSGSPDQQEVSQTTRQDPLISVQLAPPKRKSRRRAAASRKLTAVRDVSSESEVSTVAANTETSKAATLAQLCTTYSAWHRSIRMAIAVGDMERLKVLLPGADLTPLIEPRNGKRDSKPVHSEMNEETPLVSPPTANQTNKKSGFWTMRANLEAARNSTTTVSASLDPSMSIPSPEDATQLLNYRLSDGRSLLHLAVELQGNPDVIHMLLALGCRPDCPDVNGMTPYRLAGQLGKSKFSACFRRFRKAYPDRYDYEKAQIPCGPDPPPATSAKSSPSQRSRPKRTQAEVAAAANAPTQSAVDRKLVDELKFAGLSMREKCALAAERRIAATQGVPAVAAPANPIVYCCQCSTDLAGRQPFTYNDFRFCSPSCLRTHRLGTNR
uniref:Protein vms-1 n=1 Tax=Schistocephalus solidus TaxID=70667 RepID=A0A0V0JBY6_SCHSO